MNISRFKSGYWVEQFEYRSFFPTPVNDDWQWEDSEIDALLLEANKGVADLRELSSGIKDLGWFRPMFVLKEALASSRLEGNGTIMDEAVMDDREAIDFYRRDAWEDVRNHITAINRVFFEIEELPLSNRLLRHAHETLMAGVSGDQKTPGEFRRSQNWIGPGPLSEALFIPPHHGDLGILTSDLEAFWHDETFDAPDLIRLAISHYQFIVIHPFLDGNGRVGRIFIALFLAQKGLLEHPLLNVSSYFEVFRDDYYDGLTLAAGMGELDHWVKFFLTAVSATAKQATATLSAAITLKDNVQKTIEGVDDKLDEVSKVMEYLYKKPIVTIDELRERLPLDLGVADRLIADLLEKKILLDKSDFSKQESYVFKEYYSLFLK